MSGERAPVALVVTGATLVATVDEERRELAGGWVTVDDGYALWHNCNALTKWNLRHLGCEVESRSVLAIYDVKRPPALMYASDAPVRRVTPPTIGAGKMR